MRLRSGEWLIHEGEVPAFFVLLDGTLDVVKLYGRNERRITTYGPGDYFGEVPLLLGSPAVASLRAHESVRVLRLEPTDFQTLVVSEPAVNEQLLRTMAWRVNHLQQLTVETPLTRVQIVGHHWDNDCLSLRDFLARNHIGFHWLDLDNPADQDRIPAKAREADVCPFVVLPDGEHLTAPTLRILAEKLDLQTSPKESCYDVAIVGGGPAGLAAAVYGASEGLSTIMIEREAPGGQAGTSTHIENYLGFRAISGLDLSDRALEQAKQFGTEILVARDVIGIRPSTGEQRIVLDGGDEVTARAAVIATGVEWRRLSVPGIDRLVGRGVYYGASRTEAPATRGEDVYLVGGGNSAGQAALYFSGYARTVTLLVRGDTLSESMSQYLIDQLRAKENVRVETRSEVVAVRGDDHLEGIVVYDSGTGEEQPVQTDVLFVFIGADAQTDWLPAEIARDERGYVLTGKSARTPQWPLERDPYLLETSAPGIFAAGDVRHGSVKRVASSVGEGSMSIAFVHQYLAELEGVPTG